MLDLHCHLLPGVDDGPRELEASLEMCRLAAADGCTVVVATPHQRHPSWRNDDRECLEGRVAEVQAAASGIIEVRLGAEIRLDSDFLDEVDAMPHGSILALGGSRTLLIELDHSGWGPDPEEIVHELVLGGWRPLLAHPEHIAGLADDVDRLADLVDAGALLQVTAMSVTGEFGRPAEELSWRMLEEGLVHVVASDAHSPVWRPPGLRAARRRIEQRLGADWGRRLTEEIPRCLLEDLPLTLGVEAR